ncbi:TorF family putative porin [Methylomicrobium sp. Wu6]|uniref:TorF family putative porin n=1 Tax=Methylomicrobium sp. Wu6 TaxID=3107928 RepID=UPI002DD69DFF|nr:TorF family putative porin [Methylomicrobium sp. Wu6]MEC4750487.1 TorF family putative porin [Methylomicrobium sp. Wu6]
MHFAPAGAEIHASATVMSENIGKGFSKSTGKFSGLVNLDYQHAAGFYSDVNTAYVNFGDNKNADAAHIEINPYLGWAFSLPGDWRLDGQWSRYLYDGNIFGKPSDYNEIGLFLHFRDILSANVSFSEDYYQRGHAAMNYEMTGRYPVTDFLEFSAGIGYTQAERTLEYDYLYWNAGFSTFFKFVTLDLRYVHAVDTASSTNSQPDGHSDYYPPPLNPTFLFSISAGF